MTGMWIVATVLLLLCLGALMGSSWSIHALDRRYRSLAKERRQLNEWRHALQEASLAASAAGRDEDWVRAR